MRLRWDGLHLSHIGLRDYRRQLSKRNEHLLLRDLQLDHLRELLVDL
jgi:hypothetical protein